MRAFINGLLLGIILGAGGAWLYTSSYTIPGLQETERRAATHTRQALESAQAVAEQAKQALVAKLEALDLRVADIEKEFLESGRIVRRRARDLGAAAADAAGDARVTAAIKAKLAADPELSALGITVDTTAGRVTLAGSVAAPELVGRAIALALETEGVHEVVATLQVKRSARGGG